MGEGVTGQPVPGGIGQRPLLSQLGQHRAVLGGVDDHPHMGVILGRRPHHGGATHVDQLDGGVRPERIQVAHHQVDEADLLALEIGEMLGLAPVGQDPAGDDRVEGLDPATEHLRRTRQLGDFEVGDAGTGQHRGGAAAGDQFPSQIGEPAGQLLESRLVVYGQQCLQSVTSSGDPRSSATGTASVSMKARMVAG